MTLYPKWIKEDEKYVPISGTVEENSQPAPGAIVELLLGQEKVAATVTDQNGSYSFDNVENGSYNLVVTKNPGKDDEKTRTALVTVSPEQGSTQNVSLPISDVNSILSCDAFPDRKAKTDITKAVVGGLDEIAGERAVNEHKVTVELTVDSPLAPEGEEEIRELADGKSVEFFDLQLKSRLDDGIAADIGKVNDKLLTIVLPFNFSKVVKDSVSVFRYHDNTPETFGKITDSANAEDSKYMVDEENGTITLFAKKFSTYAIAFEEEKTYPTGGGGGSEKSVVSVEDAKNGSISVNKKNAAEGDTVTITVSPDEGFTLETLTVLDQNGKKIELKSLGSNRYSFEMPDGKVTISATFMEDNTMLNFFTDVKADDYFYDAVLWAAENGITQGTDSVHFSPDMGTTRAQVVTFLWRAAGSPEPTGNAAKFTDVLSGSYYEKAVAWAIEQGITRGMTNTTFSPDAVCTRGQIVTFLARFAGVEDADTESAFSDVKTTDYFAAAVKWAKDNKVTEGITKDLFGPYQPCTRAQIVTFLYRWMVR